MARELLILESCSVLFPDLTGMVICFLLPQGGYYDSLRSVTVRLEIQMIFETSRDYTLGEETLDTHLRRREQESRLHGCYGTRNAYTDEEGFVCERGASSS